MFLFEVNFINGFYMRTFLIPNQLLINNFEYTCLCVFHLHSRRSLGQPKVTSLLIIGDLRLEYEYDKIEYQYGFSVLVCRLHIIKSPGSALPKSNM